MLSVALNMDGKRLKVFFEYLESNIPGKSSVMIDTIEEQGKKVTIPRNELNLIKRECLIQAKNNFIFNDA